MTKRERIEGMKLISIDDFKKQKLRKWHGSSKRVYRQCDVERLLNMRSDRSFLGELWTRANLVDYPEERRRQARIEHNRLLEIFKKKYPGIWDFQLLKELKL